MDKLDEEIEEIRRLMLKSTKETINNKWRLTRRYCSGKMNGALQHKVWKPGGNPAIAAGRNNKQGKRSRWTAPEWSLGSWRISTIASRGAMRRSS
jgi:hypothetical protein